MGRTASRVAIWVILFALTSGTPVAAATLHGADSSFRAGGITILWAILKSSSEENTTVHIRIRHDAAAEPRLARFGVEAVDPFSRERVWVTRGAPLGPVQTLKMPRADFQDRTERWLHFYPDLAASEAHRPTLTLFYHGIPDTAPELLTETDMEAYLEQALRRMKK